MVYSIQKQTKLRWANVTLWSVTQWNILKVGSACIYIYIYLETASILLCIFIFFPSTFLTLSSFISISKKNTYQSHTWGPIPSAPHPLSLMALLCSKPLRNFLQRTTFLSCRAWLCTNQIWWDGGQGHFCLLGKGCDLFLWDCSFFLEWWCSDDSKKSNDMNATVQLQL